MAKKSAKSIELKSMWFIENEPVKVMNFKLKSADGPYSIHQQ
ncbi:hypothetical protein [Formosa algae]|nr:hypothetical protein [Formosa algae]